MTDDPLERLPGESVRANAAFAFYAMMGSDRSLRNLLAALKQAEYAPTRSWATLSGWSQMFGWVERARRFDEIQREKDKAAYEARHRAIMESGLALTHERVDKLKNLFAQLEGYLSDEKNIWLPDAKSIRVGSVQEDAGSGKTREAGEYKQIDLVHFNGPLFDKILATLEALAEETGGRIKKTENSGSIQFVQVTSDDMAKARLAAEEYEKALLSDDGTTE